MDDNVNFFGEHLRLKSFLCAVENVPQIPSRIRRRLPQLPPLRGLTECGTPSAIDVPANGFFSLDSPAANDAKNNTSIHLNGVNQQQSSNWIPTTQPKFNQARLSFNELNENFELSSTREGRSCVRGLALVRTTTNNGLPSPSDAERVLSKPINDVDPIEDSQLTCPPALILRNSTKINQTPHTLISSKRNINAPRLQQLPKKKAQCSKNRLRGHLRNPISDGFDGSELHISRIKKKRQSNRALKENEPPIARDGGLAVTSGFLPSPVSLPPTTPRHERSLDAMSQLDLSRKTPESARSVLPLAIDNHRKETSPSHSARKDQKPEMSQSMLCATTIDNQFASITAPSRHESESSDPEDCVDKEQSKDDDEESDYTQDFNDSTDSSTPSFSSTLSSTDAGENSCSQNDAYEMSAASSKSDFWSQYGATV